MRAHISSLPRTVLVAVISLAIAATLGFAQPKAETAPAGGAQTQGPAAVSEPGVLVVGVQPGSPAEKAGLSRGDIILEANGTAVNTSRDLRDLVGSRKAGDTVTLKVRHGDAQKSLSLTLGTRDGAGWMGVQLYSDGPRFGDGYGRMHGLGRFPNGALVEDVAAGSPAEKAGVKKGDVILSVDGTKIDQENTLGSLISARKVGDTVTLSVETPAQGQAEQARDLAVTLQKNPDKDAPWLGVQYTMGPPLLGRGMPGPGMMAGAFVADVTADSPAAKAGIKTRDLITRVEGTAVTTPQQVVDAVSKHKPGDTLVVTVSRLGDARDTDITVTLGQNPGDASKAWMGLSMSGFAGPRGPGSDDRDGGGMMRQPQGPRGPEATPPTL